MTFDIKHVWATRRPVSDVDAARDLLASWGLDPQAVDDLRLADVVRHDGQDLLAVRLRDYRGKTKGLAVHSLDAKKPPADCHAPYPGLTMASGAAVRLLRDEREHALHVREIDESVKTNGVVVADGIRGFLHAASRVTDTVKRPACFGVAGKNWSPAFAESIPSETEVRIDVPEPAAVIRAFDARKDELRLRVRRKKEKTK